MSSARERERLVRALAEDRREVMRALDEIESAALRSLDVRRHIAEAPAKWLLVAASLGFIAALRGGVRRSH